MILIVGGAFQGKKDYALSNFGMEEKEFVNGESCAFNDIFTCRGVDHFHTYIRRLLQNGMETENLVKELGTRNEDIVIITNELGCGVVPVNPFDRKYREITGRICCSLAKEAKEVHRVICGIGTVIKHA